PPYYKPAPATTPGIQLVSATVPDEQIPLPHVTLGSAGRYRAAFEAAFGDSAPTAERLVAAISAYCRSIRSGEAPYDRFAAGDAEALSPAARRGLELFRGEAGCASCHLMDGPRASFSDYRFHRTGVSERAPLPPLVDLDALAKRAGGEPAPAPPAALVACAVSVPDTPE